MTDKEIIKMLLQRLADIDARFAAIEARANDFNIRNNNFYAGMEVYCDSLHKRVSRLEEKESE